MMDSKDLGMGLHFTLMKKLRNALILYLSPANICLAELKLSG